MVVLFAERLACVLLVVRLLCLWGWLFDGYSVGFVNSVGYGFFVLVVGFPRFRGDLVIYMLLVCLWFRVCFRLWRVCFWLARLALRWFCLGACLSVGDWFVCCGGCLRRRGCLGCLVVFDLGLLILLVVGCWLLVLCGFSLFDFACNYCATVLYVLWVWVVCVCG